MKFKMTSQDGIELGTAGKYVADNIEVVPELEEKTVTAQTTILNVTPSDGKVGLKKVSITALVLQEKRVTPTKSQQIITGDNGTTGLSKVTVNAIPDKYIVPTGSSEIFENGTYNVTDKATIDVNVAGVEEVESVSEMEAALTTANVGKYYKYTGSTSGDYVNGDIYLVADTGS